MSTELTGVLIIGVSVLLSVGELIWVRRTVPLSFLETHHEVAGFFIGVLGVIYAILLGFVVLVVWGEFEDARNTVAREANQLGDIFQMSRGFPAPVQRVQQAVQTYARLVIDDEWATMLQGMASPRAQAAMQSLWHVSMDIEPNTARENALYVQTLERLNALSESRRLRLHANHDAVPALMSVLLWAGGVITVVFTYFFGVQSLRSQALMTAALTTLIAFVLFLIAAIDHPFVGDIRVTPEPFRQILENMQAMPEVANLR
jgi:hypothetical protein